MYITYYIYKQIVISWNVHCYFQWVLCLWRFRSCPIQMKLLQFHWRVIVFSTVVVFVIISVMVYTYEAIAISLNLHCSFKGCLVCECIDHGIYIWNHWNFIEISLCFQWVSWLLLYMQCYIHTKALSIHWNFIVFSTGDMLAIAYTYETIAISLKFHWNFTLFSIALCVYLYLLCYIYTKTVYNHSYFVVVQLRGVCTCTGYVIYIWALDSCIKLSLCFNYFCVFVFI